MNWEIFRFYSTKFGEWQLFTVGRAFSAVPGTLDYEKRKLWPPDKGGLSRSNL